MICYSGLVEPDVNFLPKWLNHIWTWDGFVFFLNWYPSNLTILINDLFLKSEPAIYFTLTDGSPILLYFTISIYSCLVQTNVNFLPKWLNHVWTWNGFIFFCNWYPSNLTILINDLFLKSEPAIYFTLTDGSPILLYHYYIII